MRASVWTCRSHPVVMRLLQAFFHVSPIQHVLGAFRDSVALRHLRTVRLRHSRHCFYSFLRRHGTAFPRALIYIAMASLRRFLAAVVLAALPLAPIQVTAAPQASSAKPSTKHEIHV